VYIRWYAKWQSGYLFGAEKHMNVTNSFQDIAFANVQLNCGYGGQSPTADPYIQVIYGEDVCQGPNISPITIQSGRWYFFEIHVRAGAGTGGLVELWINDCGVGGDSCGVSPTLRTRMTGLNLPGNSHGSMIETIWMENWANPASSGTGPLWDQVKVSRVGPIGFASTDVLQGDLNDDGQVTLADLRLQIRMLVGQVPTDLAKADLDGNGALTLADVRALIAILVGA
jgi:hypothetical protein